MNQLDIFEITKPRFKLTNRPIRLFEAFSGIGCQAMALKRLGVEYESVGFSEIDKYAIQSYQAIHGDVKNYGDITKMESIPSCDIFTYSFPCTDLSKAGQQKGLQGKTRSGLIYEVLRILHNTKDKPKVLIMENVPDLIQEKFKREWYDIQLEIEKMGYSNYTKLLNAKDYGVAQNRNRVFMVSILGDYSYKFPQPIKLEKRLKDYLEDEVDEKYYLSDKMIKGMITTKFQTYSMKKNLKNDDDIADTILARFEGAPQVVSEPMEYKEATIIDLKSSDNFRRKPTNTIAPSILTDTRLSLIEPSIAIPEATKKGYALAKDGDGVYINRPHQKRGVVQDGMIQTIKTSGDDIGVVVKGNYSPSGHNASRIVDEQGLAPTVKENHGTVTAVVQGAYLDKKYTIKFENEDSAIVVDELNRAYILDKKTGQLFRVRKLTPKECWRLMGIDDSDFEKAKKVCSNSQLYKQAGNGIVIDVFAAILKNLFKGGRE